jgi:hypothetical protein
VYAGLVLIPLANDFHTVMELSHVGGPFIGIAAVGSAIVAYLNSGADERRDNALKAFLGGGVVTFLLVLLYQES